MLTKILTLILLGLLSNLHAAIITVDRGDDLMNINDGGCDLRDAVNSANFNTSFGDCTSGELANTDFIFIIADGPIQLANEIDILSAVSITPSIGSTNTVKILAAPGERIFEVHPSSTNSNDFQMSRLHLIGGDAGENDGGAIVFYRFQNNNLGTIYIADSIFEDNTGDIGGALFFDETYATSITLLDNEFIGNQAETGGAIASDRASIGEFKLTSNKFELNSAVIDDGQATGGAAFFIDTNDSVYTFEKNQFIENSSEGPAGALDIRGFSANQNYVLEKNVFLYNQADSFAGALSVGRFAQAKLINSTIAYNTASNGGGVVFFDGRLDIKLSTIVYNSASGLGQNLFNDDGIGSVFGSIIAYSGEDNNCSGDFSSVTFGQDNVADDESCSGGGFTFTIADPQLSVLDDHPSGLHGFTPLANSPALENVELNNCRNADSSFMVEDQQGNLRPVDSDTDGDFYCDAGSIEAPVYDSQAAIANDDSPPSITEDSNASIIDVLANDTGDDPFIVIAKTNGTNGTVLITNSGLNVSYQPSANFCGSDSFTYTITGNDMATVNMVVNCVDDAPVAISDIGQVIEDSTNNQINVLSNDTDIDDGQMIITNVTQPANGVVQITNNATSLSYQPTVNYCNSNASADVFNYTLNGGSTQTVSMTVICVNDAPSFLVDKDVYIDSAQTGGLQTELIACQLNFGPGDENSQQSISDFNVSVASDPNSIINTIDVNNSGVLEAVYSGNHGTATLNVTLVDNGGSNNNGVNSSTQMVTINVRDYIFRGGMEVETCE